MKIKYDREVDILRITFKETDIEESGEDTSGVIMDFDIEGNIVGIEILQASKRIDKPWAIAYEIENQASLI